MMKNKVYFRQLVWVIVLLTPFVVAAQTTEFTYQGKLVDAGLPANANYDFEFRLFATGTGGAAMATQTRLGVSVANGIFTVTLDFGGQFDGSARWLEIAVKPAGSPNPLTVLTPRQPITSTPHSIRSLSAARADLATNSLQLGGVNASQYVLTTDSRMTDARNPLPNSANYVQNTTAPQASSSFNISGNGSAGGTLSANVVNTATHYNLDGNRILGYDVSTNLFAGLLAGISNTTGFNNSFFGRNAGQGNTTGLRNSFFGTNAGASSSTFSDNAFFGNQAGTKSIANSNSFFGSSAGSENTVGNDNSFFGASAGAATIGGDDNSFFGRNAGSANTAGNSNAFFGFQAGNNNATGSSNTIIGTNADVGASNLNFATAIGAGAVVFASNTIVLGRGTDHVIASGNLSVGEDLTILGTTRLSLGAGGLANLCRNAENEISTCSSSLRYKRDVNTFSGGLDVVRRLRPITFTWKDGGMRDVGFGAEDVEKVEPLLATYNDKGVIEGVKYGQLTTVLINAVNEQQSQIETQREQIAAQQEQLKQQKQQLNALKKLTCRRHRRAGVCR